MDYQVSFGTLSKPGRTPTPGKKFRLALMGDFSGRANAGTIETGEKLATRKALRVDVDNLDAIIGRMKLRLALPLGADGTTVPIEIGEIEDFHPDHLFDRVELFEALASLRKNLANKSTFARAATEVQGWAGEAKPEKPPRRARGTAVAAKKLDDFARLVGHKPKKPAEEAEVNDLLKRLVGPYIVPAKDPKQDRLIAEVDTALSAAMRSVLHHPDFQAMESLWRGVEFLVRRIETGAQMEIVLLDVSAEELAADLAATDTLEETGLYGMLVEQPALDAHQGPLSAIIGLYGFELAPPHADLLGRMARIAAAAGAPFIAGISPDPLATPMHEQNELIQDAWTALRDLPEAAYLGLASPRFLLRLPYGKKTDPVDCFAFEEFTRESGLQGMLFGHPALIPGLLLSQGWMRQGAKMKLGSIMSVDDIPYYVIVDADGDQIALPCTERLYGERQAGQVTGFGVMPLLSLRGRPEVRLGGFTSLAGSQIAGLWGPPSTEVEEVTPPASEVEESSDDSGDDDTGSEESGSEAEDAEGSDDSSSEESSDAESASSDSDLDSLLAGLDAPSEPAADGGDSDLDALLASLK